MKKEIVIKAEVSKKFLEEINKVHAEELEKTLSQNEINLGKELTPKVKSEIHNLMDQRKSIAIEDEVEDRLLDKTYESIMTQRNMQLLTKDENLDRKLFVNVGNPTRVVIKEGNNLSEVTFAGVFYKLLLKFAKSGQLYTEGDKAKDLDTSMLGELGHELVSSKLSNKETKSIIGASILKSELGDMLFIVSIHHIAKGTPAVTATAKISIQEAQAVIKNFKDYEEAIAKAEKKENN